MSTFNIVRAYVPVFGEEAAATTAANQHYPIDLYVPCQPKTTSVFTMLTADILMALLAAVCVFVTVCLWCYAARCAWCAKSVIDVSARADETESEYTDSDDDSSDATDASSSDDEGMDDDETGENVTEGEDESHMRPHVDGSTSLPHGDDTADES